MLSKVPGKDVTVHIIAARVRMDMKVCGGFADGSIFQVNPELRK